MKTFGPVAVVLYSLVCCLAQTNSPKPVERASTVSVTMSFKSAIQSGNAHLLWQTFDDTAVKYAEKKGLSLAFRCSGEFTRNNDVVTIPCKVPSDVADGHYYLVSVSLEDSHYTEERTYSWERDLPRDYVVVVKGGPIIEEPDMKTIQITGTQPPPR